MGAAAASETPFDANNVTMNSIDDAPIGVSEDAGGAEPLLGASNDGTFTELNDKIKDATENSTIILDKNYTYDGNTDSAYKYGIVITKNNITIDGSNSVIIDGNNLARIFYVAEDVTSFTLKNIKVQNANSPGNGGVVYFVDTMKNVEINGTFINNSAPKSGVAHFANGVSGKVKFDGIFENNQALTGNIGVVEFNNVKSGSSIQLNGKYRNNSAYSEIGVVHVELLEDGAAMFLNGNFTSNHALGLEQYGAGGVAYFGTINGNVTLSGKFKDNTAATHGSILYVYRTISGNLTLNGYFENNNALDSLVTLSGNVLGNVKLSGIFKNNSANPAIFRIIGIVSGKINADGVFTDNKLFNNESSSLILVDSYESLENITTTDGVFDGSCRVIGVPTTLTMTSPSSVYSDRKLFIQFKLNGNGMDFLNVPITVKVNDNTYTVILDENGNGNLTLSDLTPGIVNITAYYNGNESHTNASALKSIIVNYGENTKSFTDLNYELNRIPKNTIILNGIYTYDSYTDSKYVNGIELIRDVTIIGKNAVIDGAGLARFLTIAENVKSFTLVNVTIKNSYVVDGNGGAIIFNGDLDKVNISDCSFESNVVYNGYGGAIAFMGNINEAFINNTFNYNIANYVSSSTGNNLISGGAIYFGGTVNSTTIKGKFYNNTVVADRQGKGGAIYFRNTVSNSNIDANFTNNYLTDNSANSGDHFGGAICFQEKVTNTNISGSFTLNHIVLNNGPYSYGSYQGGAISYRNGVDDSYITAIFDSNTIYANDDYGIFETGPSSGSGRGGAIHISGDSRNLTISGDFINNHASYGAALFIGMHPRENYIPRSSNQYGATSKLTDSRIGGNYIKNTAKNGAAIVIHTANNVNISGEYKDNVASEYIVYVNSATNLKYDEANFINNTLSDIYAAGAQTHSVSYINFDSSTYSTYSGRLLPINITLSISGLNDYSNVKAIITIPGMDSIVVDNFNDTGFASINIPGLSVGVHEITINYEGNDTVAPSNATALVTIINRDPSSFTDLNNKINDNENDMIILDDDYAFDSVLDLSFINGIDITRDIRIDGNGHVIDARNLARIFNVKDTVKSFILTNVTLKNGMSIQGGAIYFVGDLDNLDISDCVFDNNIADRGGAIYFNGNINSGLLNSNFTNNHHLSNSIVYGGAIYFKKVTNLCIKGNFINNYLSSSSKSEGGAIFFEGAASHSIIDATFKDNYVTGTSSSSNDRFGGAIGFYGKVDDVNITGNFTNNYIAPYGTSNYASYHGGAISYRQGVVNSLIDANFTENHVVTNNHFPIFTAQGQYAASGLGGAIYILGDAENITIKGTFNNNTADHGGAIYIGFSTRENINDFRVSTYSKSSNLIDSIINCEFNNNTAEFGAAIIIKNANNVDISGKYSQNTGKNIILVNELLDELNIVNAKFDNNTINGDIIYLTSNNFDVNVENSDFTNNTVNYTIYSDSLVDNKVLNMNNVKSENNTHVDFTNINITGDVDSKNNMNASIINIINPTNIYYVNDTLIISINTNINEGELEVNIMELGINKNYTLNNGNVTVEYVNVPQGTYTMTVAFKGNSDYTAKTETLTFTINYHDFSYLQELIDNAIDGIVELHNDIKYTEGNNEINISKDKIVVNGNGHVIDGDYKSRILNISGDNVTIRDLSLINARTLGDGAAIVWSGDNGTINNVTFANNTALGSGAGVYATGDNLNVSNTTFTGNRASESGAGIVSSGNNATITNSSFVDNTAKSGAGIVTSGNNTQISGANFTNNGAVEGSGIVSNGNNVSVSDSQFTGNDAVNGAGVVVNGNDTSISGANFTNNNAEESGAGLVINGENNNVTDSTFANNTAEDGATVSVIGDNTQFIGNNITNSTGDGINIVGNNTNITSNHLESPIVIDPNSNSYNETKMKEIEDENYPKGEVDVLKDLIVSVIPSNVTVEEYTSFNVTISSSDFNGNVSISVDGIVLYNGTVNVGENIIMANQHLFAGDKVASFVFWDNVRFNKTMNVPFIVYRVVPEMNVTINNVVYGINTTVNVNISNKANGTVRVTVGDNIFSDEVVNGGAVVVLDKFNAGEYESVIVEFIAGDEYNYGVSNNTCGFRVYKANSTIDLVVNDSYDVGETISIGVVPVNSTGNLTVTINDVEYSVVNGTINLTNIVGDYTIIANLDGDDNYNASTVTKTFTIKKINTDLTS